MRKSGFTNEQMLRILQEADGTPVAEAANAHGVSEQTIYVWRRRFNSMTADDTKRLRALDQEDARLKKLVANDCKPVASIIGDADLSMKIVMARNGIQFRADDNGRVERYTKRRKDLWGTGAACDVIQIRRLLATLGRTPPVGT